MNIIRVSSIKNPQIYNKENIYDLLQTNKKIIFDKNLIQYVILRIIFSPNLENDSQKKLINKFINLEKSNNILHFKFLFSFICLSRVLTKSFSNLPVPK